VTDSAARYQQLRRSIIGSLLRHRRAGVGLFVVLGAFAASILAGVLTVSAIGVSPWDALQTMVSGSVGSLSALGDTLVFATPRLFVALGAIVAIRCGVFNLGGEGQLQLGAVGAVLAGTLVGHLFPPLHVALALVAAMAFGAVWAMLAIVLKLWRGADEIIVTLMLNFIGVYFVSYLVQGPLQPAGQTFNTSAEIDRTAQLPIILQGTRLHAGFAVALFTAAAVWFLLYRTPLGLQLRAAGLSPRAARLQGLSMGRLVLVSMAISGGISGLAGAGEVLGVQFQLIDGFSSNFGFEGLAIAFLGALEPLPVVIVAIYFGMIENGTTALQTNLSVPSSLVYIMEALPILFLAGAQGWRLIRGGAAA
jgi:ABC-type uncharacterized transport system permease subunit